MKKRILTALLTGALTISAAVGFSACGGVSIARGEKVSAAEWEEAFAKTIQLDNLTFNTYESGDVAVKGTLAKYDGWTETTTNSKIDSTASITSERIWLYDADGKSSYDELNESISMKVKADGEEQILKSKNRYYSYYEPSETTKNRPYYWDAEYEYEEREYDRDGEYQHTINETDWYAEETAYFPPVDYNTVSNELEDILGDEYYTDSEMKTSAKYLPELYDSFTYSNGKYTATLYMEANIYESLYEVVEFKVTLSFKDGYVIGFSAKADAKGVIEDKEDKMYYLDYTLKADCALSITDIGKTDVSKKLNKSITKALDKAKEEKAKENN